MSQTKRELLRAAAVQLMTTASGISNRTRSLASQPDQLARAYQADAHSCSNASVSVLNTVFPLLGYSVPMPGLLDDVLSEAVDKGQPVTDQAVDAAEAVIAIAQEACDIATNRAEALAQYLQQQVDNSEVVQLPPPDVDGADFKDLVVTNDRAHVEAVAQSKSLQVRLADLATRHGDATTLAAAMLAAADALITGLGQDIQLAKGDYSIDEAALKRDGEAAIGKLKDGGDEIGSLFGDLLGGLLDMGTEFVMEMAAAEYDPKSAGTRMGFLRSATTEAKLANVALQAAATSLYDLEPIQVNPCLIGSAAGSLDVVQPAPEVAAPEETVQLAPDAQPDAGDAK